MKLHKINLLFTKCNLACPMCSMNCNSQDRSCLLTDYPSASSGPQLTIDEYKTVFDTVAVDKPVVSIGGGEPMMCPFLPDLLHFLVRERDFPTGITTNGTLFTEPDTVYRCATSGAGFTVSVDGLANTHNSIRGSGNFERTIAFLRQLVRLRENRIYNCGVSCLFAVQHTNYREIESTAHYLFHDVGINSLTFSFLIFTSSTTLVRHARWVAERGLPSAFTINMPRVSAPSIAALSKMDFDFLWDMKLRMQSHYPGIVFEPDFTTKDDLTAYFLTDELLPRYFGDSCSVCRTQIALLSTGDVVFMPGCFEIKLGNVRECSLHDIWSGAQFAEIRNTLSRDLSPVCSHCCGNRIEKHLE